MKKQYIQPKMLLIQLTHSASLLAGSTVVGMSSEEQPNENALSRRGNFFDDEEEEY